MQELMLIQNPDVRSQAMSLAHEIRETEGVDMGTALSEAWSELSNPGEGNPISRKTVKKVAKDVGTSGLLLLAVAGLVIHRLIAKQWIWETIQIGQLKQRAIAEAQRIASPKSNPGVVGHQSVVPLAPPIYDQWGRQTGEGITVITP